MFDTRSSTLGGFRELDGKHAVVMGGAGFLGSHVCTWLVYSGARVTCLDNLITGNAANVAHLMGDKKFRLIDYDVTDYMHVPGDVDYVMNFASPASPTDYLRWPIHTLKVGAFGTHKGLGLALEKGATFFLASTSEVYGDPLVNPQPETYWGNVNPTGPRGVYDEAKRFAEALTLAYHREHDLDTRIVRIFNTYGPRMRPGDGRAVPEFFKAAIENRPLPVHGDGSQTRSLCYVDDRGRGHPPSPPHRRTRTGEHRQPRGGLGPGAGGGHPGCRWQPSRCRIPSASRRRPHRAATGHREGRTVAWLEGTGLTQGRLGAHCTLVQRGARGLT